MQLPGLSQHKGEGWKNITSLFKYLPDSEPKTNLQWFTLHTSCKARADVFLWTTALQQSYLLCFPQEKKKKQTQKEWSLTSHHLDLLFSSTSLIPSGPRALKSSVHRKEVPAHTAPQHTPAHGPSSALAGKTHVPTFVTSGWYQTSLTAHLKERGTDQPLTAKGLTAYYLGKIFYQS